MMTLLYDDDIIEFWMRMSRQDSLDPLDRSDLPDPRDVPDEPDLLDSQDPWVHPEQAFLDPPDPLVAMEPPDLED